MESNTVSLPWPPSNLSPNYRGHWYPKYANAIKCKKDAHILALHAKVSVKGFNEIHVFIEFYPPDKKRRDVDNLIASCKSKLDGIALAIGIDDSKFFQLHARMMPSEGKPGRVDIRFQDHGNDR